MPRNNILTGGILPTGVFSPATFQGNTFAPQQADMSLLARSLDKIEQRELATNQQRGAIAKALADVELNEAEDEWKSNYANDIQNQINGLIQFGDYSNALNAATTLAGKALADPALKGRVRAQQEYKKKRDEVLARADLNQVTKDRWLEQNPYHYEDKLDANGNIVGGTKWEPDWNPVSRYDMTELYGRAKQLAAVEAGGGESATFIDENGNQVTDPSKGFYGMAVKRGTKWERLPVEKLQKVFNSLFAQVPGAKDALMQDMDDKLWQYGKLDDTGKKAFIGSDIMDSKGRLYTPDEYLANKVNPILSQMAYDHRWSTIDYGQGFAAYAKAKEQKRLQAQLDSDNPTTLSKAIEIDMSERAGAAGANLNSAIVQLKTLFPNTTKGSAYSKAIANGDYTQAANILERSITSKDPIVRQKARNYINLLKTEGQIYNNLTSGFTKEEREALAYVNGREQGADVPDAANNRFSRSYAEHFNRLFGITQGGGYQSIARGMSKGPSSTWIRPADKIAIKFRTQSQKEAVMRSLGDQAALASSGIRLSKINGEDCLIVNRNTNRLQDVGKAFAEHGHRLFGWSNTEIYRLDKDNNIMSYKMPGGKSKLSAPISGREAINVLSYFSPYGSTMSKAKAIVDNAFSKKSSQKLIEPMQIRPFDNHNTLILREMRDKGYISNEDYNNRVKEYNNNNMREVLAAAQDLNNFKVWGAFSDETGNAVRLTQEQVQEFQNAILNAYGEDGKGIEIYPGTEPTGKGYGTTIVIKPKPASGKTPERRGRVIYVDGLLSTKAAESLANTPGALSRREYKLNKISSPTVNDVYGRPIVFDDSERNLIRFQQSKKLENKYNGLALAKAAGEELTQQEADAIAKQVIEVNSNVKATPLEIETLSGIILNYYKKL